MFEIDRIKARGEFIYHCGDTTTAFIIDVRFSDTVTDSVLFNATESERRGEKVDVNRSKISNETSIGMLASVGTRIESVTFDMH